MQAGIAGGGIMGKLLAFALMRAGWQVTLFDQGGFDQRETLNCSMAAAGLLTPITELEKNALLIFELGKAALTVHWPHFLRQLSYPIYFQRLGSLIVAHPQDKNSVMQFMQAIAFKLKTADFYQTLPQKQLKQFEPDLAKFENAYYFPDEGQIDNQALLQLLDQVLRKQITWFTHTQVLNVAPHTIELSNATYYFDWVFDCRGLGDKAHFPTLRSVRGELIWLKAKEISIRRPVRLLHPRYSLYIVPRPQQIYLIGASEIESATTSAISVKTILELLTAVYYINSKFSEAEVIKTVTHCRPTLPNHLPCIKYREGLLAINGLYRHGFLIAPTLVQSIMQWLLSRVMSYPTIWEALC